VDRIPAHLRSKAADEVDILDLSSSVASSAKRKKIAGLEPFLYLRTLDLSGNLLQRIEGLSLLKNISRLNLARNNIKVVDGLDALTLLQELDLSGNYITHIPKKIGMNGALQKLDMSGNNLSVLREVEHLKKLSNLRNVSLSTNPLAKLPHFKHYVTFHLRTLSVLDFAQITAQDRAAACERFDMSGQQQSSLASERDQLRALSSDRKPAENAAAMQKSQELHAENARLKNELTVQQQLLQNKSSQYSHASEQLSHLEQEMAMRRIDYMNESPPHYGSAENGSAEAEAEAQREALMQSVQSAGGHGFDRHPPVPPPPPPLTQHPNSRAADAVGASRASYGPDTPAYATPSQAGAANVAAARDRQAGGGQSQQSQQQSQQAYAPRDDGQRHAADESADGSAPMVAALQSSVADLQRQQQTMLQKRALLTRHCTGMGANLADSTRSLGLSRDEMGKVRHTSYVIRHTSHFIRHASYVILRNQLFAHPAALQIQSTVSALESEMGGEPAACFNVQQAVELQEAKKKLSEQHLLASRLRAEGEGLEGMINTTQTQLVNR
jgi:hypothetical protein